MQAEHMTWEEYRDEVVRRVIILPVGAFEQHGPHLPILTDTVTAIEISCVGVLFLYIRAVVLKT